MKRNPDFASHPLLKGVSSIWGPTDVYGIDKLPPNTTILVRGEVVAGPESVADLHPAARTQ